MHEFFVAVGEFIKSHWLDIIIPAVISLVIIDNVTKPVLDANNWPVKDLKKKFSAKIGWLIASAVAIIYWVSYFGLARFGKPKMGKLWFDHFPIVEIILAVVISGASFVLYRVAKNRQEISPKELTLRFWGMVSCTLAWVIFIVIGLKLWFVTALMLLVGVLALQYYSIPIRKRGVASIFDKRYYGRDWWLRGKKYLDTGLHFLFIPWWWPGFKIILVDKNVVFFQGATTPLPTKGDVDKPVGADVVFDYECDYVTGQKPEAAIILADTQRADPEAGIKLRMNHFLKKHSMSYTMEQHLDAGVDTEIDVDDLNGLIDDIEDFVGVKILRLKILDPTPSAEYRDQAQKTAAAEGRARELKLLGKGEGDKRAAELEQVARMLFAIPDNEAVTPQAAQAAANYLLGSGAVNNTRNVFIAPKLQNMLEGIVGRST